MMSESFVAKKLAELEKLDLNNSGIGYELQRFYGIIEVLGVEAYEEGVKLHSIYKQFEEKYLELSNKHSNMLMEQSEKIGYDGEEYSELDECITEDY